jgi:hypothetical protein
LGLFVTITLLSVALAITAGALITVLLVPFSSSNRLNAVAVVFGGGIFLLAFVAAVVAVLAYNESSRRPRLRTEWFFRSLHDGSILSSEIPRDRRARNFNEPIPVCGSGAGDLVPLEPVKLQLRVENSGEVAAKNVAVALYLEGIYFSPPPSGDPHWSFSKKDNGWQVQWEGGVDRPVYPGAIPRTPFIELTGMWAFSEIIHSERGIVATFADDLKEPRMHPLAIDAAPPLDDANTE